MTTYSVPHKCALDDTALMNGSLADSGQTYTCPVCGVKWVTMRLRRRTTSATQAVWIDLPTLPALQAAIDAVAARTVQTQPRQATVAVAALLINTTVDVTATWDTAFPDTGYLYDVLLPSALLGKVTVTQKTKTAAAVVLTVKANAAVAASTLTLIGARSTWQ